VTTTSVIVFDMDGVLVEVTESYRETIQRTVEQLTGVRVSRGKIQDYKNEGGWNNDWMLTRKIAGDLGVEVPYETVVERFQKLFLGPDGDGTGGLILRERWLANPGLLERLGRHHRLSIFTGRGRREMDLTLRRCAPGISFDPTVCMGEVEHEKPAPDGLLEIAAACPGARLVYVGDTVDDARAARAADVPFIGIASAANPRREELVARFAAEQPVAVLEDINELEAAIGR